MLDLMRRHAKSWIINIIIAAIVIVFIFWGAGTFRRQELTKAAEVNGEPISIADFEEAYRQLLEMARAQYGDYLDEELLQTLDLKKQTLERLINERLMFQQARSMGLKVTDEDLQARIARTPAFQVDGVFNPDRYRNMLARFRYTPEDYERLVRRELLTRKIIRLVSDLAKVSPREIEDFYHLTNDKVSLDFILFAVKDFREKVKPTEGELAEFFEKNKENYRVPLQVQASYLLFRPKDFEGKFKVSEDELSEYYELNVDSYREPEKIKVRHILFRIDPNASPEEAALVRSKAETVRQLALKGEDFAKLAQEYSEGPTAKTGGDLGWLAREQMIEPFAEAAFKLEKGRISDPVRTDFGLHLIKIEDRRPARTRTFEEAKDEIREKIITERAREMAADQAAEAYEQLGLTGDFKAVAEKFDSSLQTTELFSANTSLIDRDLPPKFNEVALTLKPGDIGPLVDLEGGQYVLMKCLDRKDSYLPKLEEFRAAVEGDLSEEKALEMARQTASDFLSGLKDKGGWEQAVEKGGLAAETTGPFTRGAAVPKIGPALPLIKAAFALTDPGQVAPEPYQGDQGYYAIRLKEHLPASEKELRESREELKKRLEAGKGQLYLQQWLETLKAQAEIEVEDKLL